MLSQRYLVGGSLMMSVFFAACAPASPSASSAANPPAAAAPASAPVSAQPAAGATSPPVAQPSAPRPPRKIKVDYASYTAVYAPFFIATDKGYLAEEGLEMEMIDAPGTTGIAAVLAGETQFTTSASSSLSAILTGSPMKIVYTNADRPGFELWSSGP